MKLYVLLNVLVTRVYMVRPVLEYASTVLDLHTSANINIFNKAARFYLDNISNFSSVTDMLRSLNLPPLKKEPS